MKLTATLPLFLFLDISTVHSRYHQNNRGKYKSELKERRKKRLGNTHESCYLIRSHCRKKNLL